MLILSIISLVFSIIVLAVSISVYKEIIKDIKKMDEYYGKTNGLIVYKGTSIK